MRILTEVRGTPFVSKIVLATVIPWTYDVSIKHENFMIYEEGEPYCRGFVFEVVRTT